MGQIDGKVATVTGGASGLGAAFAATLAREDAKMVVTDVDDAFGHAVSSWFWIPCRQLPHATTTPAVRLVLG